MPEFAADRTKCLLCYDCVAACLAGARTKVGYEITVEQAIKELIKDAAFFRRSGGGVTISGGEPLMQPEFCELLITGLKAHHIHVAIETTGMCSWDVFKKIATRADLILYDLKTIDTQKHIKLTGVSNQLILENACKVPSLCETVFRILIVPGLNNEPEDLKKLAAFIRGIKPECSINLLPYHKYGIAKYKNLGRNYTLSELHPPTDEEMEIAKEIFLKQGLQVNSIE